MKRETRTFRRYHLDFVQGCGDGATVRVWDSRDNKAASEDFTYTPNAAKTQIAATGALPILDPVVGWLGLVNKEDV